LNLKGVFFQRLDPRLHIGGVLFGVMRNARILAEHPGGDFRAQLLAGVWLRTERSKFPVHAGAMARPVTKLVNDRAVILFRVFKIFTRGQMDGIVFRTIKSSVALVVLYNSTGSGQNAFALFNRVPCKGFIRKLHGGNAVDLLRIKNSGETHDRPVQFHGFFQGLAVFTEDRLAVFAHPIPFIRELVKNDRRGLAAGQYAHALVVGLLEVG
jgi:hypothetical protein